MFNTGSSSEIGVRPERLGGVLDELKYDSAAVLALLDSSLAARDFVSFVAAYRKYRFFLSIEEGESFDQQFESLQRESANADPELLREITLTRFVRGESDLHNLLEVLVKADPNDVEAVRYLLLSYLYSGYEIDPTEYLGVFSEREAAEFRSNYHSTISPTLLENLSIVRCPSCRTSASLSYQSESSSLDCNSCSKQFPISKGVPEILPKSYEHYQHLEPEYQEVAKKEHKIWSQPELRNFPVVVHQLHKDCQPYDQKLFLKMKYYKAVHWNMMLKYFRESMGAAVGAKVLDVGCAQAPHVYAFSRMFPQTDFFGVDVVRGYLQNAQRYKGNQRNQFLVADASTELPFADNSFDFVFSINAIEHCRGTLGNEIFRVLKPGARAFIGGPSEKSYIFNSPNELSRYLGCVESKQPYETHGINRDDYLSFFEQFEIVEHRSDGFFYRFLLEDPAINEMSREAAESLFKEFCGTLGQALDATEAAKWYNYIQLFMLEKPA